MPTYQRRLDALLGRLTAFLIAAALVVFLLLPSMAVASESDNFCWNVLLSRWIACQPGNGLNVNAGQSQQVPTTPTVANSSHTSGQCVGTQQSVTVAAFNGQSGFLTNFRIASETAVTPTLVLYLFSTDPAGSHCSDGGAFTLATTDIDKLLSIPQTITLSAPASGGTPTFGAADFLPPRPFGVGASVKTLWFIIVAASTFTPGANGIHTSTGVALNN